MKKSVLVTETSFGIGRAPSKEFAAQGWNVIVTMRNLGSDKELIR